jgi:hypothetical protein
VLALAIALNFLGAAALSAPNPSLDAARLDVLPAQLWGRGEAVRTVARQALVAFAPLTFGWVSLQFGGPGESATVRASDQALEATSGHGLEIAFLVLLSSLFVAGVALLLGARRTYPRDLATAVASSEAIGRERRYRG